MSAADYKIIREGIAIQVVKISSFRYVSFVRARDDGIYAQQKNAPFKGKLRDLYAKFREYPAEDLKFANDLNFEGLERESEEAKRAIRIRQDLIEMLVSCQN